MAGITPASVSSLVVKPQKNQSNQSSNKSPQKRDNQSFIGNSNTCNNQSSTTASSMTNAVTESNATVILQTASVNVTSPINHRKVPVKVMFDTGSDSSYITSETRSQLAFKSHGFINLDVNVFGANNMIKENCEVVDVPLTSRFNSNPIVIKAVVILVISESYCEFKGIPSQQIQHLQSLQLAYPEIFNTHHVSISVLLGCDFYWNIINCNHQFGQVALDSSFGYVLSGKVISKSSAKHQYRHQSVTNCVARSITVNHTDVINQNLSKFMEQEHIGISDNDKLAYESVESLGDLNSYDQDQSRYVCSLPWKFTTAELPNNYNVCLSALNHLLKQLVKQPSIMGNQSRLEDYDSIIQEQIRHGVLEVVPDPSVFSGNLHYLTHHPVVRTDHATTKLRIVCNGSKKQGKQVSLNECLERGPSLILDLFHVLLRFRSFPIALIADIKKAFS